MNKLSIKVQTRPGKKKEFLQMLKGFHSSNGLIQNLRHEKVCIQYSIRESVNSTNEFFIESEWKSLEELEAHFKSNCYSVLLGAIHILCNSSEMETSDS